MVVYRQELGEAFNYCGGTVENEWLFLQPESYVTSSAVKYIGVTPGKTYDLAIALGGQSCYGYFSYSQSINNHAVDIEAY